MLTAYMDDSGSHDGAHHCLVAGYWGGQNEWRRFERAWTEVLQKAGIEDFHAKEFWPRLEGQRLGRYAGWPDSKHRDFIDRLLRVIHGHKIYPFACGVRIADWNQLSELYRKVFCGKYLSLQANPNTHRPIYLPLQRCILRAASYCRDGLNMNFVLDSNQTISANALACFSDLKASLLKDREPIAEKLGSLHFSDRRRATPLQAADLLAYELYRYGKKMLEGKGRKEKMRPEAVRALLRFKGYEDFWLFDEERMNNGISLMERKIEERLASHSSAPA
jgi:hypothetical protein